MLVDTELEKRIAELERAILEDVADEHHETGEIDALARFLAQATTRKVDEATAPLNQRRRASKLTRELSS